MNDITKVGETLNANETMTSLVIAEVTGKEHKSVMRDIRILSEQVTEKDGYTFVPMSYIDAYNRQQPMYSLGKKECFLLASGYSPLLRAKIIDRWIELENKELNNFYIPQTLSEALLLASNQAKQIEEQQKLIEVQTPKVEFFDAVADSKSAVPMISVAKVLSIKGLGRNNLFEFLRSKNILMRNNQPYQKYVDLGYFRVIEQRYQKNNEECINIKTLVYQKGVDFIRKTILSNVSSIGKNNKELNN